MRFANQDYLPVLKLWHIYFKSAVERECLVIALDEKTNKFCELNNYNVYFSPYLDKFGLGFMQHQMLITRKLLDLNYSVLISDIDAIWLKDPLEFTLSTGTDLVFSPGTFQPFEAYSKWGNVLCSGYFLIRPSKRINKFLDKVQIRMKKEGDQPAINKELISRNLNWENDKNLYEVNHKRKKIKQSLHCRIGIAENITVTLLPNWLFQRIREAKDPLIFHPLSLKDCDDKLQVFRENGFLFKRAQRINNRFYSFLFLEKLIKNLLYKGKFYL